MIFSNLRLLKKTAIFPPFLSFIFIWLQHINLFELNLQILHMLKYNTVWLAYYASCACNFGVIVLITHFVSIEKSITTGQNYFVSMIILRWGPKQSYAWFWVDLNAACEMTKWEKWLKINFDIGIEYSMMSKPGLMFYKRSKDVAKKWKTFSIFIN